MYTEVLGNPTGNAFLATSKNHDFLLSYANTVLHTSTESRRLSHNYVKNPSPSTTTHMELPPSNPSDPLYLTYYDRKRDAQTKHVNIKNTVLKTPYKMLFSWT